jgi:exocyst complex component 4
MNDLGHGIPTSHTFSSFAVPSSIKSTVRNAESTQNPEADSFAYMESVLESLAVLGRLGNALDNVAQRLPGEIYTLVETTLDEVTERMEYGRQGSMFSLITRTGRSEGVYVIATPDGPTSFGHPLSHSDFVRGAFLRLTALESSSKHSDHEILRDFFWTLYSKMDAVAQGLRVIYEVANRIGSVRVPMHYLRLFPSKTC